MFLMDTNSWSRESRHSTFSSLTRKAYNSSLPRCSSRTWWTIRSLMEITVKILVLVFTFSILVEKRLVPLPVVHLLQNLLCLQGLQQAQGDLSLPGVLGVHGLLEDQVDPLFQEDQVDLAHQEDPKKTNT